VQSSDVSVSDPIQASQYNNLRADVISNVTAIASLTYSLGDHIADDSAVHGLGSGIYALGSPLGADYRVDAKTTTITLGAGTGGYIGVSWSTAFSNPPVVIYSIEQADQEPTADRLVSRSTTAATIYVKNPGSSEYTFTVHVVAVGA